tara:strand:- start:13976 stop:14704 length:729 start_codon:yes stop_codon:yes gene_type:complete
MKKLLLTVSLLTLLLAPLVTNANDQPWPLQTPAINIHNTASLQRGARDFMNRCAGCHSLQAMTYEQMGRAAGIVNEDNDVYENLVKDNLIFTGASLDAPIRASMDREEAVKWLGKYAPDLSHIVQARSRRWVYTFLMSYYADPKAEWGVNNLLIPDIKMPDVLANVRGKVTVVYQQDGSHTISHLQLQNQAKIEQTANDLTNFLTVVGEPHRANRANVGFWILLVILLLSIVAYLWSHDKRD